MWELFTRVNLDSLHRSGVKWDAFQFWPLEMRGGKRTLEIGNMGWNLCIRLYVNATSIFRLPLQLSGKLIRLLIDSILFLFGHQNHKPVLLFHRPASSDQWPPPVSLLKNKSDIFTCSYASLLSWLTLLLQLLLPLIIRFSFRLDSIRLNFTLPLWLLFTANMHAHTLTLNDLFSCITCFLCCFIHVVGFVVSAAVAACA